MLRDAMNEQAGKFEKELAAGAGAERAEWIRTWLAFNKMNRARIAKEEEERSRPRFLN
jgi:hypothetical protein